MKDLFEEILNDAKREFNPTLNELSNALKRPIRLLKGYKLEDKKVVVKGISIHSNDTSVEAFLTKAKECEIFLEALVEGKVEKVLLRKESFSEKSKLIDLLIVVNAIGQTDSFPKPFSESLLNFALNKMFIKTDDKIISLNIDSIVYLEADGHNTKIFFNNGEVRTSMNPLAHFKDRLPKENFYSIHASYFLNVNYVDFVDKATKRVHFGDSTTQGLDKSFVTTLPVSDKWESGFFDFLLNR